MAAEVCTQCAAVVPMETRRCPQCAGTDFMEQGEWLALRNEEDSVPSISREQGPSIEPSLGQAMIDAGDVPDEVVGMRGMPQTGRERDTADEPGTEPGEHTDQDDESEDESATGHGYTDGPQYDAWSYNDLQAALKDRNLPATGTKTELIERLETADRDTTQQQ